MDGIFTAELSFPAPNTSSNTKHSTMNVNFNHIPPFYTDDADEPYGVNVIVETPKGSGHKYAWKETYGIIELRRILRGGMVWPCDFGFIPQTHAEDGDAIDVALLI